MIDDEGGTIAYEAVVAFTTLFVIAIAWNVVGPSVDHHVFDYAENEYNSNEMDDEGYGTTFTLIKMVWKYWPIILLIGVMMYLYIGPTSPQRTARGVRAVGPPAQPPGALL